ncbi:hypothetical protein RRF57_009081 [Xylaria bambusicola]|uniref:Uncharacterized protein n=1 Tax=Xylaria bambusicola TaxID=326684 RepID=A0AAN7Z8R7_9PEZI
MPPNVIHLSSNGGSSPSRTNISTSTSNLFMDTSTPSTSSQHTIDMYPIIQSISSSVPLIYFEHHHEDRLMGFFAGLARPSPQHARQAYNGYLTFQYAQKAVLLGVGAWSDGEVYHT